MASSAPETGLKQAQNRARQFLDTNNSLTSKISDEFLSLLEAGEGSFYLRDQLDNMLNDLVEQRGNRSTSYSWAKLRQLFSIKDKIAYVTAMEHTAVHNIPDTDTNIIPEDHIKETLENIIQNLERELLSKQEFCESWILRHAAINRFECKLDTKERSQLNTFSTKVKKLCDSEGFDILAEAVHFTFESDAQKIMKISEVLSQLSAMGTTIPAEILEEFGGFEKHIQKLKDLDKSYKHLTKTLNMIHRVAKTTEQSMISPKQQKIVDGILEKMKMKDTIDKAIVDFNDPQNFDKNEEHTYLEGLLDSVKNNPEYKTLLAEQHLEEKDFASMFSSWMGFRLTHGAHTALARQKGVTFGADKLKDFEQDAQSWRGNMRKRIFEIYDRNVAGNNLSSEQRDFANDEDFRLMDSYFTKFPDIFFAKDEDNYRNIRAINSANPVGPDTYERHFDKMRSILAAIIRRKNRALDGSDKIRRGSWGDQLLTWADHAFKGKDRGIFLRIQRAWKYTDDATILAMTIMLKNEATNKMFYEDKDPFEKKERWYSKIFKKVAGAERGLQGFKKTFSPAASTALKATEITAKGAVGLTALGLQKGASLVTTPLDKVNGWLSKQSNFNPLKLGMVATKPIQWLFNPLGKGVKYTDEQGNEKRKTLTEALGTGYKNATEALPDSPQEQEKEKKKTKYLFQRLTRGIGKITEFFGEGVAASGQWMYDSYTTSQQQGILGAFYTAAHKEDWRRDLMNSSDLANALNLKVRGPYIFDEDGRILPVDKPAEKYPEDADGIKKLQKDRFAKEYDDNQAQIVAFYDDLRKKFDDLDKKMDDVGYGTPEYENIKKQLVNIGIQNDTWNEKLGDINALLAAIQRVGAGSLSLPDFVEEVTEITNTIKTELDEGEKNVTKNKETISQAEETISENKKKKETIKSQLDILGKGDRSSEELRTKKGEFDTEKEQHEAIRQQAKKESDTHLESLNDKEAEKEKTEKALGKIISKLEERQKDTASLSRQEKNLSSLEEEQTKVGNKLNRFNAIDLELVDIRKKLQELKDASGKVKVGSEDEFTALQEKQSLLQSEKQSLDIRQINSRLLDIQSSIDHSKRSFSPADIEENNRIIGELEKTQASLEGIITDCSAEIKNLKQKKKEQDALVEKEDKIISKIEKEIEEIREKLKSKGPNDKSWVELDAEKAKLDQEITTLENQKKSCEKQNDQLEQRNKVLRKIGRRGQKIQETVQNLENLGSTQDEGQRHKLLKKALQNLELSFEKKVIPVTPEKSVTPAISPTPTAPATSTQAKQKANTELNEVLA